MQAIKCEMCGSTDLIKQDGVYVCQHCGMKYDPVEARKLMVEISGKVALDNSEKLDNLYRLARKARASNDSSKAAEYYGEILLEDPSSWEANFYSTYFRAMNCTIAEIAQSERLVKDNLIPTKVLITESQISDEEKTAALAEIGNATVALADLFFKSSASAFFEADMSIRDKFEADYSQRLLGAALLSAAVPIILEDRAESDDACRKAIVDAHKKSVEILGFHYMGDSKQTQKLIADNEEQIRKYDPSYVSPKKNGGCYVATCVYGSYDCPQVWTLRRFRDNLLARFALGRLFIRFYYAVSPSLVKLFGRSNAIRFIWRIPLDLLVDECRQRGFSAAPYSD